MISEKKINKLIEKWLKKNKITSVKADSDKVYVIQIDVGDMPKEMVSRVCKRLTEKLNEFKVKGVFIPKDEKVGKLSIYELSPIKNEEDKNENLENR